MTRAKAAVAAAVALLSLAGGVSVKLARDVVPEAERHAAAWFARRGTPPDGAVREGPGGIYRLVELAPDARGCRRGIVELPRPEEVVSLLRREFAGAAWDGAMLWAGDVEPLPDDWARLRLRLLWRSILQGSAPVPAAVLPLDGGCATLITTSE